MLCFLLIKTYEWEPREPVGIWKILVNLKENLLL